MHSLATKHLLTPLLLAVALAAQDVTVAPAAQARPSLPTPIAAAAFPVSVAELLGDVRFLADPLLAGRRAATDGARIAAAYVAAEFVKLGLEPAGTDGSYEQTFDVPRAVVVDGAVEARKATARNVVAWLPGSDPDLRAEHLLVGAHFDHLGVGSKGAIYRGADDNASGVAAMLGVARALVRGDVKPRRSVLFVAFGAEEEGLRGSWYYTRNPLRPLRDLVAMVNLDMVGRRVFFDRAAMKLPKRLMGLKDDDAVGLIGGGSSAAVKAAAIAAADSVGLTVYAPEDFPAIRQLLEAQVKGRADHWPFAQLRVPHLFFSTSEHDDYHQPTDTPDKVHGPTLHKVAQATHRAVLALAGGDERPAWSAPAEAAAGKDEGKKDGR